MRWLSSSVIAGQSECGSRLSYSTVQYWQLELYLVHTLRYGIDTVGSYHIATVYIPEVVPPCAPPPGLKLAHKRQQVDFTRVDLWGAGADERGLWGLELAE